MVVIRSACNFNSFVLIYKFELVYMDVYMHHRPGPPVEINRFVEANMV